VLAASDATVRGVDVAGGADTAEIVAVHLVAFPAGIIGIVETARERVCPDPERRDYEPPSKA
jgi:hypothetical protein